MAEEEGEAPSAEIGSPENRAFFVESARAKAINHQKISQYWGKIYRDMKNLMLVLSVLTTILTAIPSKREAPVIPTNVPTTPPATTTPMSTFNATTNTTGAPIPPPTPPHGPPPTTLKLVTVIVAGLLTLLSAVMGFLAPNKRRKLQADCAKDFKSLAVRMEKCNDEEDYAALWDEFNKEILQEPQVPEEMTEGDPDEYTMTPKLKELAQQKNEEVAAALADDGSGGNDDDGDDKDGKGGKGGNTDANAPDDLFFVDNP